MDRVILKIEQTHDCGQVMEQIWHVDKAEFSMRDEPSLSDILKENMFIVQPAPKRLITFEGECSAVEFTGIEFKGRRFQCVKCGEDVLFPDREKATLELSKEQAE